MCNLFVSYHLAICILSLERSLQAHFYLGKKSKFKKVKINVAILQIIGVARGPKGSMPTKFLAYLVVSCLRGNVPNKILLLA